MPGNSNLKLFFSASNLNKLTVAGQQAFFKKQLDSTLMSVLEPLITSTTPVFDDDNMPGMDSCFSHLNNEFMLRYPLVARRFEFFSQSHSNTESLKYRVMFRFVSKGIYAKYLVTLVTLVHQYIWEHCGTNRMLVEPPTSLLQQVQLIC